MQLTEVELGRTCGEGGLCSAVYAARLNDDDDKVFIGLLGAF